MRGNFRTDKDRLKTEGGLHVSGLGSGPKSTKRGFGTLITSFDLQNLDV
jgi:hypothetical protein